MSRPPRQPEVVNAPNGSSQRYMVLAVVAAVVVVFFGWWNFSKPTVHKPTAGKTPTGGTGESTLKPHKGSVAKRLPLRILCPFDGSLFPPEIAPTRFQWEDGTAHVDRWTIRVEFEGSDGSLDFTSTIREWTPAVADWEQIKRRSTDAVATVAICGVNHLRPEDVLSRQQVTIRTSREQVGAPIFYREVNLPFSEAIKDPAKHIRWRFGSISSEEQPPVVMEKMPLCANCHSFSADGSLVGMDVDYGSDKGSYVISPVSQDMIYDNDKIITWSDYKREDNRGTLGLLSQVSPDGRYVISTVKDRSVFVPVDRLAFSQLFFPIQGILAYYDRQKKTFRALRGADDEQYVQSNATWSPDGKYIVFARSKAYHSATFEVKARGLTRIEDVSEFLSGRTKFKFDLWRVPFNDGQGGEPEPVVGASNNGMSNYFPKISPDGKWLVFCRAKSFMLLQPDSALYIIPAEGGEARRLACNTTRMNSWHSWSPNSKWLVFSSKALSPYTQLFLTHVDDQGHTTPPVVLSRFTSEHMAANIPEFVNADSDAIRKISQEFVDDLSYLQAGKWNIQDGDYDIAIQAFQKALAINPENAEAHVAWGNALFAKGDLGGAESQYNEAIALDRANKNAHWLLGALLEKQGKFPAATQAYERALAIDPEYALAHQSMGRLDLRTGATAEGREHLLEAARCDPGNASPYIDLANSYLHEQRTDKAKELYRRALAADVDSHPAMIALATLLIQDPSRQESEIAEALQWATKACQATADKNPSALIVLADVYAASDRLPDAISAAQKALEIVYQTGPPNLAATIRNRLQVYEQQMAAHRVP